MLCADISCASYLFFQGKIKIVVNKMLSMRDIKVNVIFSGFKGSNLSDHSVKYERKPGDSNTIRLEVVTYNLYFLGSF